MKDRVLHKLLKRLVPFTPAPEAAVPQEFTNSIQTMADLIIKGREQEEANLAAKNKQKEIFDYLTGLQINTVMTLCQCTNVSTLPTI